MTNTETFAQRLQRLMDAANLTQVSLAAAAGIKRPTVQRILGRGRVPTAAEIRRLAGALKVSPDDLVANLDIELPELKEARADEVRLLAAELARDEAVARAEQAEVELQQERRERQEELQRERAERATAATTLQTKLEEVQDEAKKEIARLGSLVIEKDQIILGGVRLVKRGDDTAQFLRQQIAALQQQLAQERASKIGTSLLAGLAGAALGRSID